MAHVRDWKLERSGSTPSQMAWGSARGFTLLEILVVVALMFVVGGMVINITPQIIRSAKGSSSTTQVKSFLAKVREAAVTRRRNIELRFELPNRLTAEERPVVGVPVSPDRFLETLTFEGGLEYIRFPDIPDTPDLFGMAGPVNTNGAAMVLFTSEGTFTDANGDFVNVTLGFATPNQPLTANAITILGTTAAVRHWRWNGTRWNQ
jgi:prepilin-type N-terminal cleavage/methylation domain-containing protein